MRTITVFVFCLLLVLSGVYFFWGQKRLSTQRQIPIRSPVSSRFVNPTFKQEKPKAPPPLKRQVNLDVPFTSQSPFAQWKDPRQQDGCEEASVLMAVKWARGEKIDSKQKALDEILTISLFQSEKFQEYRDTSAKDTLERIAKNYYEYSQGAIKPVTKIDDVISELNLGNVVITPMNGRALNNPHFTPPGPERHMVLVKGYDLDTEEIITNDPGIREGANYRYPFETFLDAIRDYPTGYHVPIEEVSKVMIVFAPQEVNER